MDCEISQLGVQMIFGLICVFNKLFELFSVDLEGFPALVCNSTKSQRDFPPVGFLDPNVTCIFQLREVDRQVTLGEPGFPLEVEKIGAFGGGEDRQDDAARWLVDQPVDIRKGRGTVIHRSACRALGSG